MPELPKAASPIDGGKTNSIARTPGGFDNPDACGIPLKLIIQIPCLNEATTLPATIADLPRAIPGIEVIELLVVDDGSRDGTADVARACGVDHIVRLRRNKGLAAAFAAGIDASLKRGADFIVNTDADNQYAGKDISKLLQPLLRGEADIVIGDRNIADLQHMSWRKRQLQRLGSWVVRQVSNTSVPDTTSGFRAYTREAALRMTIVSEFSYTLESIIQAGRKRMAIAHVPIDTNPRTRPSRLFDSLFSYIKRSSATIVRIYAMYEPLKVFTYIGIALCTVGAYPILRFVYVYVTDYVARGQFMQSLIVGSVFLIVGFQILLIGLLADVISANRKLLEDLVYRVRSLELPQREPEEEAERAPVGPGRSRGRDGRNHDRWER
jgi:glycosyltransferase involved in cell wall biosynthesis